MRKYAKMLGLAAVAALALMAFVGTSGAAASAKVCSTSGVGAACASGHGSELTTQALTATTTTSLGQDATLTSGFITVTCDSHMEGEVTHGGSGNIWSLTFTNCTSNLGSCTGASTTATKSAPYAATGVATSGGNGKMEVLSEVKGTFTCVGTTCVYSAPNAGTKGEIVVTGGETATVTATKVPLTKTPGSGTLCSSTANWDGTYEVTNPDSLWLT